MSHDIIAWVTTGVIAAATLLAVAIVVLLVLRRPVSRWLALGDGVLCVSALGLHFAAQVDGEIGAAFAIAIPFVAMGAISGVVMAWRGMRQGERPRTLLTVAHAANLLLGLILVIEGVLNVWGPNSP